jgi:hypothetical protein
MQSPIPDGLTWPQFLSHYSVAHPGTARQVVSTAWAEYKALGRASTGAAATKKNSTRRSAPRTIKKSAKRPAQKKRSSERSETVAAGTAVPSFVATPNLSRQYAGVAGPSLTGLPLDVGRIVAGHAGATAVRSLQVASKRTAIASQEQLKKLCAEPLTGKDFQNAWNAGAITLPVYIYLNNVQNAHEGYINELLLHAWFPSYHGDVTIELSESGHPGEVLASRIEDATGHPSRDRTTLTMQRRPYPFQPGQRKLRSRPYGRYLTTSEVGKLLSLVTPSVLHEGVVLVGNPDANRYALLDVPTVHEALSYRGSCARLQPGYAEERTKAYAAQVMRVSQPNGEDDELQLARLGTLLLTRQQPSALTYKNSGAGRKIAVRNAHKKLTAAYDAL